MELEYDVDDMVATIRLNRPERKNSFTYDMIDTWADALRRANLDPQVRAVVLTGTGDAFCAGVDLNRRSEVDDVPHARMQSLRLGVHSVAREVRRLDKPLIAAVNGPAVGAGMDMALMCDVRFASANARLSQGYIRVGLIPGDGGCYLLPRLVGTAKALELMWTGDFVGAAEAEAIGLVSRVCKPETLMKETYEFARRIAAAPPLAVAAIKRVTYQSLNLDFETSLEVVAAQSAVVQSTADSKEALAAFREKRDGHYIGA
jgi:enoyl-CoA hydratase/carnithine racemase